ncbi:hypothetical protein [Cellulosilyticum lentocellum]|uniref:Uncharacterized protein n=1 Tax=Cellulosilyticum lentocellum (strain ATCC 49066 / DSM 5427 / NCIMB 11756 / RHM5) TaxID=642492 RepID=F2JH55_CELLD|nr:hypothetical protein [Cellulosilyticum lentocellum]ADZ81870.1 hypothetical protein Clole_0111 [Cellulosilyticum lentocellum DSM 5427]
MKKVNEKEMRMIKGGYTYYVYCQACDWDYTYEYTFSFWYTIARDHCETQLKNHLVNCPGIWG